MSDLAELLRLASTPEPVSAARADELARMVQVELARRPGAVRLRRASRVARSWPVAAAAALLLGVVAIVVAGGGDDEAANRVGAGQAVPFHGTYVTRTAGVEGPVTEVWLADIDHRRIESADRLVVTDGDHVLHHGKHIDEESPDHKGGYARLEYRRGQWDEPLSFIDEHACDAPVVIADEPPTTILDRRTRHVRCTFGGGLVTDVWSDVTTGIVLRQVVGDRVQEVTSLDTNPPRMPDDLFATEVPDGGVDVNELSAERDAKPLGPELRAGARLPTVQLDSLRGDPFDLPPSGRWTLLLVTAAWCPEAGCGAGWPELRSGTHPGVVVVSQRSDRELEEGPEGFDAWTSDVPVGSSEELEGWDIRSVPTWVVFRPDGRVADAEVGPLTNLAGVLAAVADDREPPELIAEEPN